jgi:capsid protein
MPQDQDALFGATEESEALARVVDDLSLRRWDGAATHRLNAAQFEDVTGRTINEDLVSALPVLMARCSYEASTNPTIEGMIGTHAIDIVGPDGPQWQVLPKEPNRLAASKVLQEQFADYAAAAEDFLQDWFLSPDLNGELSGVEILTMDCTQQWTTGNSVVQVLNDEASMASDPRGADLLQPAYWLVQRCQGHSWHGAYEVREEEKVSCARGR